jgi:hypothetical protein
MRASGPRQCAAGPALRQCVATPLLAIEKINALNGDKRMLIPMVTGSPKPPPAAQWCTKTFEYQCFSVAH